VLKRLLEIIIPPQLSDIWRMDRGRRLAMKLTIYIYNVWFALLNIMVDFGLLSKDLSLKMNGLFLILYIILLSLYSSRIWDIYTYSSTLSH
jgi:hypothetical protein